MSQINGDKSRFNRERKQNIQRRLRNRKLLEAAGKIVPVADDRDKKEKISTKKIKAIPAS